MRLLPTPLVLLAACGTDFGVDEDGDGFPSSVDCDDTDPDVSPGAAEACDGVDNNCDGQTDIDATEGLITFYADLDDDGAAGDIISVDACEAPDGYLEDATDCDDLDDRAAPGLPEVCDGVDNDCDAEVDEDGEDITWYADADADGFGDEDATLTACAAPPGHIAIAGDCNDGDPAIHPGADETCASPADDNCDDLVDNNPVDGTTYYLDLDGDGFAGARRTVQACVLPDDALAEATDCDDVNRAVFPDAPELCNGIDDDCDDQIDVGALDAPTWYADADGDGYGDPGDAVQACEQPADTSSNALDCNPDSSDSEQPGTPYWVDTDGDGVGAGTPILYCDDPGNGFAAVGGDCNDGDSSIRPGATEVCDDHNVDEDCNGLMDDADDDVTGAVERFLDLDGDGYGTHSIGLYCDDDTLYAEQSGDCDDEDANRYPGAPLTPDGRLGDCDICGNASIEPGELIINEVLVGPPHIVLPPRPGFEWVELLNTTDRPLPVCGGWEIAFDETSVVFGEDTDLVVPAAGLFLIGQSTDPDVNGGVHVDLAYGIGFEFPEFEPRTVTFSVGGTVIDTVPFTGTNVVWFGSSTSIQLDPGYQDAEQNDCMDYWCTPSWDVQFGEYNGVGTPGEENLQCQLIGSGSGCSSGSGSM